MKTITRAKGGSRERKVRVDKIKIPDLWAIAHLGTHEIDMINFKDKEAIREVWHLCHDLLRAVREAP